MARLKKIAVIVKLTGVKSIHSITPGKNIYIILTIKGKTEAANNNLVCFEKRFGNLNIALIKTNIPKKVKI